MSVPCKHYFSFRFIRSFTKVVLGNLRCFQEFLHELRKPTLLPCKNVKYIFNGVGMCTKLRNQMSEVDNGR